MASRRLVLERNIAAHALGESNEVSTAKIAKALKDRSPRVRETVVRVIQEQQLSEFVPDVEACLSDRNWMLRAAAAVCIGELLESTQIPHLGLRNLVANDPEWVVRIDAMESLASIEDSGAIEQIATRLDDENGVVRSYCAGILVEMSGRAYKSDLRKLLQRENDPRAKVGILAALFSLGDRSLLPRLLELLHSEEYQTRCAVVHSVENLRLNPEELNAVIKALVKLRRTDPTRAVTSTITTVLKTLRSATGATVT
jgi:HEAT repeat protein